MNTSTVRESGEGNIHDTKTPPNQVTKRRSLNVYYAFDLSVMLKLPNAVVPRCCSKVGGYHGVQSERSPWDRLEVISWGRGRKG